MGRFKGPVQGSGMLLPTIYNRNFYKPQDSKPYRYFIYYQGASVRSELPSCKVLTRHLSRDLYKSVDFCQSGVEESWDYSRTIPYYYDFSTSTLGNIEVISPVDASASVLYSIPSYSDYHAPPVIGFSFIFYLSFGGLRLSIHRAITCGR